MRLIFFIMVLALGFVQCKENALHTIDVICHPGPCQDTIEQDPEAQKILKDANISVTGNTLNKDDSLKVAQNIATRVDKSNLSGKSKDEIFKMYSDFLSKYDSNNKIDTANNRQWNNDPFFQAMHKDTLLTEKVDALKEKIFGK